MYYEFRRVLFHLCVDGRKLYYGLEMHLSKIEDYVYFVFDLQL